MQYKLAIFSTMKFAKIALVSLTFPSALCIKWNTRSLLRRNGGDFSVTSQQIDLNGQGLLMPASGCLMNFFCLSFCAVLHPLKSAQTSPFVCSPAMSASICHSHALSTPLYYGGLDNPGPHRVDLASTHAR